MNHSRMKQTNEYITKEVYRDLIKDYQEQGKPVKRLKKRLVDIQEKEWNK